MNRVNDLVAEFAFPPLSPHIPSSSSCLFLDILDQSNAWKGNFWCQDGFSRHVTLEEPPKLWHPSPPASQTQRSPVSRGRAPSVQIIPSCPRSNNSCSAMISVWAGPALHQLCRIKAWRLKEQFQRCFSFSSAPSVFGAADFAVMCSWFNQKGSKCMRKNEFWEPKPQKISPFSCLLCFL